MNKKLLFAALLSVTPFAYGMLADEVENNGNVGSCWEKVKNKLDGYDGGVRDWCNEKIVKKLTKVLNSGKDDDGKWEEETVVRYLKWITGGGFGIVGLIALYSAYNDTLEDEDEETHNKRAVVKALLGLGLIGSGAYVVLSGVESQEGLDQGADLQVQSD